MDTTAILHAVADDIECQLRHHDQLTPASILTAIPPGLATALLQKSIRRGRVDLALMAANVLLRAAPDRLWRRLAVIAIEDVGLGDIDAVYMTIVASAQWRRLVRRFGDQRLVNFVVSRMASAAKCRASDDLFVVTADCPAWDRAHLELADLHFSDLLSIVASDGHIERRAMALRLVMGAEMITGATRRGHRHHDAVFDFLCEASFPQTLVEISRAAYRQTGEVIAVFLPLLHREFHGGDTELMNDHLPPEVMVGGIPSWAIDGFSREGRRALAQFLNTGCPTARWLRANVSSSDRMTMLRHAQFRVEAGLVADRLVWPTGVDLRRQADLDSWSFGRDASATLLSLMRKDIDVLNHVRGVTYVG